ncbi:MAG: ATP-dependent helicase HrpB [Acetobacteraceae bacterium]
MPVAAILPALATALADGRNVVLRAPPGSGKTTLVPPTLLAAGWRGDARILLAEPRRLATRAAATRMAALHGQAPGGVFGFRTRQDAAVSAATRVEVLTEGLLLRRLLADPLLEGVAAVILDEIHERSLESDLALALLLDLQRALRPDLRLIAMSATAETDRLSALLEAVVIESEGRPHPVTIRHAARDLATPRDLPEEMARATRAALAAHPGDILAFLPGMAEIRRTEAALAGCPARILALHGDLPRAEQDAALAPDPAGARRVILASPVAETSLTVPGVRVVIDGGFRRAPRFDPATGLTRLGLVRISRAAATQRAGRAGREAPGVAIRLWTEALGRGLPAQDRPEILAADLAPLVLTAAAWTATMGTPREALRFADPPPAGALAAAETLLRALGALDADRALTPLGARMSELGAHPRLAAMMLAAEGAEEAALAAALAALLEERDPLRGTEAGADVAARLATLNRAPAPIRRAAGQYRARLGLAAGTFAAGDPGRLIAAAYPDRIAARRAPGQFRLAGGGGAVLDPSDPLARAPLLAVAALGGSGTPRIALAAPLDPTALPPALEAQVTTQVETSFDPVAGAVLARRRRRLGALVLSDTTAPADPAEIEAGLRTALAGPAWDLLSWSDAARQLRARVARMRALEPEVWPDFSDAALRADIGAWLGGQLGSVRRRADLAALDLAARLRARLGRELAARLDRELPAVLPLPHGQATVDYTAPEPLAAARAQAFYGLDATPHLAGGRVPLRLALLSPAGRPAAITADLAAFWRGGWAETRAALRGRYPKHDWPEAPWNPGPRPDGRGMNKA